MKSRLPVLVALAVIVFCALGVGVRAATPWPGLAGLAVLGVSTFAAHLRPRGGRPRAWLWPMLAGWLGACAIPVRSLDPVSHGSDLENHCYEYLALTGWLAAAALLPASLTRTGEPAKLRWQVPALGVGAVATTFWLVAAYLYNLRGPFYLGLLLGMACLVLTLAWFRLPAPGIQAVNTLILLLVGLPVVDRFIAPHPKLDPHRVLAERAFSYAAARNDPMAFARWWECFLTQMNQMFSDLFMGTREASITLRPNADARLFDSRIHINSRGFRGAEIPADKGRAYRIVALGESTTFGYTLMADDKPWPELLQGLIRQRLNPSRPVQVINAGTPCYTLENNVGRLASAILPLKPDLVISYHGFNGFDLLDPSLPPVVGAPAPEYCPRPLNLLAACEFRLKLLRYRRSLAPAGEPGAAAPANVLDTPYASAYRRLAEAARTNGFRLVIANYSMAVNQFSDPKAIQFYRAGFPTAEWLIKANEAHSLLVSEIARQDPFVRLVDTHPGLDGQHEKFIDLIHFTQEGDRQMAETMFAGIRDILEQDLKR